MSEWLGRLAACRVHLLLAEVPGWESVRLVVEQQVTRQGWVLATSPADADVLLVCGAPGPELARAFDAVWAQLPGPRARGQLLDRQPAVVAGELDRLARQLRDTTTQRVEGASRPVSPPAPPAPQSNDGGHDRGGHAPGGHAPGSHEGSGHAMGQMLVAGLPLAQMAPTRDGLTLDVLHVPLGPVLPHWPAGLVVNAAVQGDVITEVDVQVWPAAPHLPPPASTGTARARAVWAADHASRLLDLAGWTRAAAHTRQARDLLVQAEVDDAPSHHVPEASAASPAQQAPQWEEQARRLLTTTAAGLRRARLLRATLRDVGVLSGPHVPGWLQGDALTRLWGWYDEAAAALAGRISPEPSPEQGESLALLPGLLTGLEVRDARLAVASLGLTGLTGELGSPPHAHPLGVGPETGPGQPAHAQAGEHGQ